MIIRPETPADGEAIGAMTSAAFRASPHGDHDEAGIVEALRAAGALAASLVADEDDEIVGHAAFSPVTINGEWLGWYGLGPVSVRPDRQGQGIGAALIREGLDRLRATGAAGFVVLGDPAYYRRFGFAANPALIYPPAPAPYFQALSFGAHWPAGVVAYHPAFDVADA
jgi:putative acetyltransferase